MEAIIMTVKTAVGVAVAAACLMSFSAIPGAKSQTAPGYYGSQTHPSNAHPNAPTGSYESATGNYVPRAQGNAYPNPAMGTTGSQASPPGLGTTEAVSNSPQGSLPADRSARRNVIESQRYDRLLENNRGFREARIRKECGPIADQQLRQQCIESFAQYEPAVGAAGYGSSTSSGRYRSNYGR